MKNIMKQCVLVTDKEFIKAKSIFELNKEFVIKSAPTEEPALTDAIIANDCRAVILGVEKYTGRLYEALGQTGSKDGAIIARFGVGHDGVDKIQACLNNIVVTNTPGALDISVAEHAIGLIGSCVRHVAQLDKLMHGQQFLPITGNELAGRTLVVVGFGPIGRRVARIAGFGFQMKVIAVDVLSCEQLEESLNSSFATISNDYCLSDYRNNVDTAFAEADIISLHLPAVEATRHFINSERLEQVKHGAVLINTARGSVVDESVLYDALYRGQLSAAGLDVYENEPYIPFDTDKDLRKLKNTVMTPHVGSNTIQANERMAQSCVRNIECFFQNKTDEMDLVTS